MGEWTKRSLPSFEEAATLMVVMGGATVVAVDEYLFNLINMKCGQMFSFSLTNFARGAFCRVNRRG